MDILPAIDNLKQGSGRTPTADRFNGLLQMLSNKNMAGGSREA
jgi:hypothetical protein